VTEPEDDRDPVDVLAEEFADRLRRGEHPSVSDYAAKHPEVADQLRELLPAVARMEQLKRFRRMNAAAEKDPVPDRFGDFRIVRELGRGGMGVVFEAVQESLGRRVALKVLAGHAQLHPTRRERFLREARAAARLHHTNIVPVFGAGEQDGLPYYVMQLIPGRGLHALVRDWRKNRKGTPLADASTEIANGAGRDTAGPASPEPPPYELVEDDAPPEFGDWQFVADLGLQAAAALQYAHEQGVLHRDVKPANLLLDPSGRVWVTDFGLAKLVDHDGLTATGDILGTLQYLAPECLHCQADPRSDVYGLGAVLYELLTLEPPFPADSPARLVRQIGDADPPPPRELNPAIPRDLETIVLTAMAREPARRYASAELLADDLRAFLDDRPIRARRSSWVYRGWRWCHRNPTVALLSLSTVTALVLAAVVGWVGYARTQRALTAEAARLDEAERARADVERASAKLEANLRLSLDAFESLFDATGGDEPRGGERVPGAEAAERVAVLESVLAFYDRFAEQNATNPRLQFEAAKAHRRVGQVHRRLGRWDKSEVAFRRAGELLEGLCAAFPDDEGVRFELVLAYAAAPPGAFGPDPLRPLTRAAELARGLSIDPRRWVVVSVFLRLGEAREHAGDRAGAAAAYQEAVAFGAVAGPRRPPQAVIERATARQRLAALLVADGRLADARRMLEDAVAELRSNGREPGNRPVREALAAAGHQLAGVCARLGDGAAAEAAREEAVRWANMPDSPQPGRPGAPGAGLPGRPGAPGTPSKR
jgi:serine/threonine protein kinase/tetratricopeptide (TPR) repeat protein